MTSSLPVSRVFVIVQTMSVAGSRRGTVSGPASSVGLAATCWFALAVSMQTIDFW